ncbi:MAG: hypothetical protein GY806_09110 [Gammaproteobacteria bacterium]|nr:hypothetical protein [Gammaproteobacteria bacterium]
MKISRYQLFSAIIVTASILFGLALVEYMLGWYRQSIDQSSVMDPGLMHYDANLGWKLTPGWTGSHSHHDFLVNYTIDKSGFRNQPELPGVEAKNKIALIGDSFTFGLGVNDNETFAAQLALSDTDNQYINMGIPAYSTDQEYLLMKQINLDHTIDHYVLMFYLGNDIIDNTLQHPIAAEPSKPYFVEQNETLLLKNHPVAKVRKSAVLRQQTVSSIVFGDFLDSNSSNDVFGSLIHRSNILKWFIPIRPAEDANTLDNILDQTLVVQKSLLTRLLEMIKLIATERQVSLTLAILPGKSYIESTHSYSYFFQNYVRKFVLQQSEQLKINIIDVADELARKKNNNSRPLFHPNEGHLTAEGNRLVSQILHDKLL